MVAGVAIVTGRARAAEVLAARLDAGGPVAARTTFARCPSFTEPAGVSLRAGAPILHPR